MVELCNKCNHFEGIHEIPEAEQAICDLCQIDEVEDDADDDDNDDDDDDEQDFLLSDEAYDSQKALTISRHNEESKSLRKERRKLTLDRRKATRNLHEVFVKEKNSGLRLRRLVRASAVASSVGRRAR